MLARANFGVILALPRGEDRGGYLQELVFGKIDSPTVDPIASYCPDNRDAVLPERVHQRTRHDHASEIAEDYVEAIADRIAANGVCRSLDLAKQFAVTHATVNNNIARLQRDGLVTTEPYQPIELTTAGKRLATASRKRHEIVKAFLEAMGVSVQTAATDSEGIEHHVSKETLDAMKQILDHGWPVSE